MKKTITASAQKHLDKIEKNRATLEDKIDQALAAFPDDPLQQADGILRLSESIASDYRFPDHRAGRPSGLFRTATVLSMFPLALGLVYLGVGTHILYSPGIEATGPLLRGILMTAASGSAFIGTQIGECKFDSSDIIHDTFRDSKKQLTDKCDYALAVLENDHPGIINQTPLMLERKRAAEKAIEREMERRVFPALPAKPSLPTPGVEPMPDYYTPREVATARAETARALDARSSPAFEAAVSAKKIEGQAASAVASLPARKLEA